MEEKKVQSTTNTKSRANVLSIAAILLGLTSLAACIFTFLRFGKKPASANEKGKKQTKKGAPQSKKGKPAEEENDPDIKKAKNTLMLSVVSMFLCLGMLVGVTYAWFTDTSTSGINQIVAGNLDVELEYFKDGTTWTTVTTDTTDIFGVQLWEPGSVGYAYLKITNKGTLAVNYKFALNTAGGDFINVNDESKNLKDALVFKQFAGDTLTTFASREEAYNKAGTTQGLSDYTETVTLSAGETRYISLVIVMPTTVGNEYNYKTGTTVPVITFGLKLIATQASSESDGFDNTYDVNATYPVLAEVINETKTYSGNFIRESDSSQQVTAKDNINIDNTTLITSGTKLYKNVEGTDTPILTSETTAYAGTITSNIKTTNATSNSVTYSISYTYVEGDTSTSVSKFSNIVTNTFDISKGLTNVKVTTTHNGGTETALTSLTTNTATDGSFYYDSENGKLYIYSSTYSQFKITYDHDFTCSIGNQGYVTLAEAFEAAQAGETILVISDYAFTALANPDDDYEAFVLANNVTIDLNGKTLTCPKKSCVLDGKNLLIKNGTFAGTASYPLFLGDGNEGSTITVKDVTVNGGINIYASTVTLENVTADASTKDYYAIWAEKSSVVTVKSGTYKAGTSGLAIEKSESTISITGGTFTSDPSAYVAEEYMATKGSDNNYTIEHKPICVNGVYYKTIGEVFEKCSKTNGNGYELSGENAIVLYADIEDGGLYVGKDYSNVVIDFNGHTYTVSSSVGSQGTTSQAMHFESTNSTITLKNGTIKVKAGAGIYQCIQNYTNFTAENMTFDFTNVGNTAYATIGFNRSATNETFTNCVITLPECNTKFYANGTLTFNNTQTNADIVFDGDPLIFKCDSTSTFNAFRKTTDYTNTGVANEGTTTEGDYTIYRANCSD